MLASAQQEVASAYPQPGWVEQSGRALWESQLAVARAAVRAVGVEQIWAIGIANQRETALLWQRATRKPLGPAVVWQCRRTAERAAALAAEHGEAIRRRSGLTPDAYFSGPKFAWLLDHVEGARELAAAGEVAAGTVDSWLLANLTQGAVHATDPTNASRTMLWHLGERRWDAELCAWQDVPADILPQVQTAEFGVTAPELLGRALPILAVAGDQQAALAGHGIAAPGAAKCTYGTGAFLLAHAGQAMPADLPDGLLLTAAADGGYALEGGVFTAGSVVQWLRDGLGLAPTAAAVSALAASVPDSGGVMLVPALAGLGSPHWDPLARGAILGLSRGSTKGHVARAALEAVAFRVREIAAAMEAGGTVISELRVDGGMTASDVLLQIQANALQRPVLRPAVLETTALGAARLAMEAAGVTPQIDLRYERFEPNGDLEAEFARWSAARAAVQSFGAGLARSTSS